MARECILADDDVDIRHEYHKFVLIRDIDDYNTQQELYEEVLKRTKNHNCCPLGPYKAG